MPNIKPRTIDELESMALLASRRYIEGRSKSVEEALATILKQEKDLSEEHIKRVVEKTNTNVLQNVFHNERDRAAGFPLADPEKIISGYGRAHKVPSTPELSDYAQPPADVLKLENNDGNVPFQQGAYSDEKIEPRPEQKVARKLEKFAEAKDWAESSLLNNHDILGLLEKNLENRLKSDILAGDLPPAYLEKYAYDRPEIKPYIRSVFKDLVKSGDIVYLDNLYKQAEATENAELDESHPLNKLLNQVNETKDKIDALTEALDVINVQQLKSRKELLEALKANV